MYFKEGDYVRIIKTGKFHENYNFYKQLLNSKGIIKSKWVGIMFKWHILLDSGEMVGVSDEHIELVNKKIKVNKDQSISCSKRKKKLSNRELFGI